MKKQYVHNIPAARNLRKPQTPTEAIMWEQLRDRRLAGHKFRRQHAVGQYVLDFFCPELQCAVEIDGGIHNDAAQRLRDTQRQADLEAQGIWFVRISADCVANDLAAVLQELAEQLTHSRPARLETDDS